jgi:hypothetical protein
MLIGLSLLGAFVSVGSLAAAKVGCLFIFEQARAVRLTVDRGPCVQSGTAR